MTRRRWVDALLVAGVLALVALALVVGAGRSTGEEEAFGGTDAAVTAQLEADGYVPWFRPLFAPGSGEVESGLFAVQAALGAGVLGYCVGAMRRRAGASMRSGADARPGKAPRILLVDLGEPGGGPAAAAGPSSPPPPPSTPPGR